MTVKLRRPLSFIGARSVRSASDLAETLFDVGEEWVAAEARELVGRNVEKTLLAPRLEGPELDAEEDLDGVVEMGGEVGDGGVGGDGLDGFWQDPLDGVTEPPEGNWDGVSGGHDAT